MVKLLIQIQNIQLHIIDITKIAEQEKFIKDINSYLKTIISIPCLIKKINTTHFEIYDNIPKIKRLKKFIKTSTNSLKNNSKQNLYPKINHDFLVDVFFKHQNFLVLFYIKNTKSDLIINKIIKNINKTQYIIVYSDITNTFSYKLSRILEVEETDLPCLRFVKFEYDQLFYTKRNRINLIDKDISKSIIKFIEGSEGHKIFLHNYSSEKIYHTFKKNMNMMCVLKRNIINLYYNEICEYCLKLYNLLDDVFSENKYLIKYYDLNKIIINNNKMNILNNENSIIDEKLYYMFLPRLIINDVFNNKNIEYNNFYDKNILLKFLNKNIYLLDNFK